MYELAGDGGIGTSGDDSDVRPACLVVDRPRVLRGMTGSDDVVLGARAAMSARL